MGETLEEGVGVGVITAVVGTDPAVETDGPNVER